MTRSAHSPTTLETETMAEPAASAAKRPRRLQVVLPNKDVRFVTAFAAVAVMPEPQRERLRAAVSAVLAAGPGTNVNIAFAVNFLRAVPDADEARKVLEIVQFKE